MLALAGYQLGVEFRFFDPNSGAPVGQIGELIAADYGDQKALERFLDGIDVVTYEFESIPLSTVRFVAERVKVFPPVAALETAQDRLLERACFSSFASRRLNSLRSTASMSCTAQSRELDILASSRPAGWATTAKAR